MITMMTASQWPRSAVRRHRPAFRRVKAALATYHPGPDGRLLRGCRGALVSDPAAPFGGVMQPGLGREGEHEGLLGDTRCSRAVRL
jgi:hypothetical protein